MVTGVNKIIRNKTFLKGLIAIVLAFSIYLTFGLSTISISHDNSLFWVAHLLGAAASCVLTGFLYVLSDSLQCRYFNHFMVMAGSLLLIGGVEKGIAENFGFEILSQILFLSFFIFAEFRFFKESHDLKAALLWCRENIFLIITLLVTAVLSYDSYMTGHKWDGVLYAQAFDGSNIYSISANAFYTHISQGAGAIIYVMKNLCGGNVLVGLFLANLIAQAAGILAFYGTIKRVVPEKGKLLYLILTAVYAFSPYILGMAGYASVDFFSVNLFMTVVYFTVTRQWFLQVFAGFMFVFTKEPAIIIYGFLCIGILIIDFCETKWKFFSHIRYYGMLTVALLWLVTLKFIGIWSGGNSSVGVDTEYIDNKLSVLFVLNFSWLLVALIIIGIVISIVFRKKIDNIGRIWKSLVPVLFSMAGFTLFSSVLITVNHARYADNIPPGIYLLFAVVLLSITDVIKRTAAVFISTAMMILMLISSFFTIDPVSMVLFPSVRLSNGGKFLSVNGSRYIFGDATIYNRQAMWQEGAYGMALAEGIKENALILVNGKDRAFYALDGMMGFGDTAQGEYLEITEYWNEDKGKRECFETLQTTEFTVYVAGDEEGFKKLFDRQNEKYLYIYTDELGIEEADTIRASFDNIEEKDYTYRGFVVHGMWINE